MAELACVRESTSVAWACKVRGGTASSPSDYTWESGLLVSLQRLGSTLLKNGWLAFTVASASIQISASSCPSTLSTNISFAKLGGSSVYISGPVTEAWTERPGEECFLWSFDRHSYLSLPQKLRGCRSSLQQTSCDLEDGCHMLEETEGQNPDDFTELPKQFLTVYSGSLTK
ncbi:protein cornichon homolog 3 isoform X4 [Symphalangus syndactylus]|uniref:protein cornichon homolog 3 isoform X4 n=1 Tax=Symphalangus syndactylus TaxID=9590 RepID=UPI0030071F9C